MLRNSSAAVLLVFALGGLTSSGCSFGEIYLSDPLLRQAALDETQRRYSALVRWSAFAKAARYVEPEAREDFLAQLPGMKTFRFSDFESEPVELNDQGEAIVRVTYYGSSTASPFEVEVYETQHWKRSGITNDWRVTSEFKGLAAAAGLAKAD